MVGGDHDDDALHDPGFEEFVGDAECEGGLACAWCGDREEFRGVVGEVGVERFALPLAQVLQDGQSACPLMESVAPPRDQGVMWSPCQPGSSSVPQLEQRPPEARYIATRSAVLKRRRVERLASPREGGVESATSATPTGCLATAPALAEARGFFVSLAVDVVGTLLLRGGWRVITRGSGACTRG